MGSFEEQWRQNAPYIADAAKSAPRSPFVELFEFWRIGAQLRRLYEHVPSERVFVILLDDVQADPRGVYLSLLDFLGVDDDGRTDFPVKNSLKVVRSSLLARMPHVLAAAKAKSGIDTNFGIGVGRFIHKLNYKFLDKPRLSPELRAELQDYFSDDILLLQELLGRDLSHWLAPAAITQAGAAD
ncbi:hypothetical protein [Acidocella sp. KAb 2-4]|uniref:hypothetical protein n=1 Tax=Acidocella sp. KAb 2-4 TaxID=2885158 RepID=UPI001D082740|nr:hypothetical protein [Acidocella sp. KAb 2-4]MCB5943634.1 hypothetical protein [Acidocella sp. KAb 2-4]